MKEPDRYRRRLEGFFSVHPGVSAPTSSIDRSTAVDMDMFLIIGCFVIGILTVTLRLIARNSGLKIPIINEKQLTEITYGGSKARFQLGAKSLLQQGFDKSSSGFVIISDSGPRMILANKYAREIHNHPDLDLSEAISEELHSYIPGLTGYANTREMARIGVQFVKVNLKRMLGMLTETFPVDAARVLQIYWTENKEWHQVNPSATVLDMVAELTSHIISGAELGHNPEWRRLCVDFTVDSFIAAKDLDNWWKPLRSVVHWFLPSCRKVRHTVNKAYRLATPVVQARERERRKEEHPDLVDWFQAYAKGESCDPVMSQLIMAQAVIHPTADMMTKLIVDLCGKDKLVSELRSEIISVVGQEGWTQSALSNLKYLDSVMKESQRLKPISLVTMKRYATKTITLSDGTVIPKGTIVSIFPDNMWKERVYPQAGQFRPDRFLRLREDGQQTTAQFVSIGVNHMGFGYGNHACPGRFFGSTLIKVVLCHLLLKYEWRLVDTPQPTVESGFAVVTNPLARLEIRRRQEEVPSWLP
ncbi:hypothetical protein CNMCM6106_006169 [Aspergillus hiratsukae]|nr:hypothetical protein CNMCM6106_006169 [Aspergillus hiratsukae]